jgi:mannose-6-phosphate isomerase-like protein (cupin superfamily)
MTAFATLRLAAAASEPAPDGSAVCPLLRLPGASMARFELAAGQVARAIVHCSIDEVWYVISGHGELWRKQAQREETVILEPGICVTIPAGTQFQFRASAAAPVVIIGVSVPGWPGDHEAMPVDGPWTP